MRLSEGFNLSQAAIYSISNLMNTTFTLPGKEGINAWVLPSDGIVYEPTAMQRLYNSQDLEATFASLAKSMTNHIRRSSDDNTIVNGKEGKNMILILVRGWF